MVKNGLGSVPLSNPMLVHSFGAEMRAEIMCPKVKLLIERIPFLAKLIVLDSQELDVILSMNCLSKNRGQIDYVTQSITLTNNQGMEVIFAPRILVMEECVLNHLQVLEEVLVMWEYPDVFLEDLPRMPPNRDIDFMIDLVPR